MNKKKRCPRCKRMLRTRCFTYNEIYKEELCTMCHKKIGTNKFYSPLKHKENKRVTNFNMTDDERKVIAKKKGWKRVTQDLGILNSIKRRLKERRKQNKINKEFEKKKKEELNRKFIEGLK